MADLLALLWKVLEKLGWPVMRQHPRPFVAIVLLVGIIAGLFWWVIFNERIETLREQLNQAKNEVQRYKLAAGIDTPGLQTAFTVLTDGELIKKSQNLAKKIRHQYRL